MDCALPQAIVMEPPDQQVPEEEIDKIARALERQLAFEEAVWGLIGEAILLPLGHTGERAAQVGWRFGNNAGGWSLPSYMIVMPGKVKLAGSFQDAGGGMLGSPDLFLLDLKASDLTAGVEESLRLAVACLRRDLFMPAIAMLGRASEGAWIELGRVLAVRSTTPSGRKLSELVEDPRQSAAKKMDSISKFAETAPTTVLGPDLYRIHEALTWSHLVRDARNAIHYSHEPATLLTFETVAALLLAGAQHIRTLFSIRTRARRAQPIS